MKQEYYLHCDDRAKGQYKRYVVRKNILCYHSFIEKTELLSMFVKCKFHFYIMMDKENLLAVLRL